MRIALLSCWLLMIGVGVAEAEKPKPLKALLITGGCCHDYTKQKVILTEGISQRANVEWTILQEGGGGTAHNVSIHAKKDWAKGYDIVVHNECFSGTTDVDWIHNITDAHKAGVAGIVIHCAMHCYRGKTDQWFNFCGVRSHGHGAQLPIVIDLTKPQHPIVKGMPAHWTTVPTEMYTISEVYGSTIPLAEGIQVDPQNKEASPQKHACIWVGQFGKGKVFGTTLGHHNQEFEDPMYLDFMSRGLLWACGKLGDNGKPLPGYEGTGVKAVPQQPEPQPTPAPPRS